ncbi:hypothetical protein BCCR75501_06390 [Burkholderia sola]|nr:hypothetical protein BCCR75501_06390 [Burkholderia cenocepacia]
MKRVGALAPFAASTMSSPSGIDVWKRCDVAPPLVRVSAARLPSASRRIDSDAPGPA